jgi:hypothetical protein
MYTILSTTLLILLMLGMQLPLRSTLSVDDGFFVVPEEEFYDPSDYDVESSLPSGANTSEKFKSEHTLPNENTDVTIGSQNYLILILPLLVIGVVLKTQQKRWS